MSKAGKCPICARYHEILAEHHCIPREMILNGIKGIDGPTVDLCAACHTALHAQAVNNLAKKAEPRTYFSEEQLKRAAPYLKVLEASISLNEERSACSNNRVVVEFSGSEFERLHLKKRDCGYTNLAKFTHDLVIARLNDLT